MYIRVVCVGGSVCEKGEEKICIFVVALNI